MKARLLRKIRGWAYQTTLIRYCVHCDGSANEAEWRGRPFRPDRWIFHTQHERQVPQGPALPAHFFEKPRPKP